MAEIAALLSIGPAAGRGPALRTACLRFGAALVRHTSGKPVWVFSRVRRRQT